MPYLPRHRRSYLPHSPTDDQYIELAIVSIRLYSRRSLGIHPYYHVHENQVRIVEPRSAEAAPVPAPARAGCDRVGIARAVVLLLRGKEMGYICRDVVVLKMARVMRMGPRTMVVTTHSSLLLVFRSRAPCCRPGSMFLHLALWTYLLHRYPTRSGVLRPISIPPALVRVRVQPRPQVSLVGLFSSSKRSSNHRLHVVDFRARRMERVPVDGGRDPTRMMNSVPSHSAGPALRAWLILALLREQTLALVI